MTTYPQDILLAEPNGDGKCSDVALHYMASHSRHLSHELLIGAFLESGMTKAELARRLGWDPSRLGRVLNVPANVTVETLGQVLYAIDGSAPTYGRCLPFQECRVNYDGPDWLVKVAKAPSAPQVISPTTGSSSKFSAMKVLVD